MSPARDNNVTKAIILGGYSSREFHTYDAVLQLPTLEELLNQEVR